MLSLLCWYEMFVQREGQFGKMGIKTWVRSKVGASCTSRRPDSRHLSIQWRLSGLGGRMGL